MSQYASACIFLALLTGCGSGNNEKDPDDPREGVLLVGNASDSAIGAVLDYTSGDVTTNDEISTDADGVRIDRTNLELAFTGDATIGEVNGLIESVDGRIVNMLPGVAILVLKIPDPGDLVGLQNVVDQLVASPLTRRVTRAHVDGTDVLPENYDWLLTTDFTPLDHQLAIGGTAAWNAKEALTYLSSETPRLLQNDYFGDGPPNADFNVSNVDSADFVTGDASEHGYHVLGIITGVHGTDLGQNSPRELVTGLYPGTLPLRVVDRSRHNAPNGEFEMVRRLQVAGANTIVNTSLHSGCARPPQRACVEPLTLNWLEKIRGLVKFSLGIKGDLESRFIHLASAGNFRGSGTDTRDAALNSQYSAAHLIPDLKTSINVAIANTTNTLVVENRTNTTVPFAPGCLSSSSKYPGDISAIGDMVLSYTGAESGADNKTGTSMSTPQVAGLAAYVWALNPSLTPEEAIDIIVKTARSMPTDGSCGQSPKKVIDAYAAVLAVDDPVALEPMSGLYIDAPVRLAILDIADGAGNAGTNLFFDDKDLALWIDELDTRNGARDYSRFDLNGDGMTGLTTDRARFNLDMDIEQVYSSVTVDLAGSTVTYDENAVNDWEVLCHYAYSNLYSGDTTIRDTLLEPFKAQCGVGAEKLVFFTNRDGDYEVYVMNTDGTAPLNISNSAMSTDRYPSLSPDGAKVAFETGRDLNSEIYVVNVDGTGIQNLTNDPSSDRGPVWSPDGTKIAFRTTRDGNTEIYVMNANGTSPTNVSNTSENDRDPVWSPDSTKLLFVSVSAGIDDIFVVNANGTNRTNLTNCATCEDAEPAWSPDGTKIVYSSYRDTTFRNEIYVMNANGSSKVNLTSTGGGDHDPTWSPDGTKIVYSSLPAGNFEIYVMNADGTGQTNLTNFAGSDDYPVWLSDGSRIVFESTRDGNSEIYSMNPDGAGLQNLTGNAATDSIQPN